MDESEVLRFEQAIRPLKFSGAIRMGALMRPKQCKFSFFAGGGSCALGAAIHAKTGKASTDFDPNWPRFFGAPMAVIEKVMLMNDNHDQTRESIADWVESQGY